MSSESASLPFVGLRPYEVADAGSFFGRDIEADELAALLLGTRLVVVYGRSGVGKSSLLRAGALGRISRSRASVLPVGRPVLRSTLPAATAPDFNPLAAGLLSSWAPHLPLSTVRRLSVREFLQGLDEPTDRYGDILPLVAPIDQVEAMFADTPSLAAPREQLLAQLVEAMIALPHLHLVLCVDQSALGELLAHEDRLSRGDRALYRVTALGPEAAREAIAGPFRLTGRTFAPGAAEALVERLRRTTVTNSLGDEHGALQPTVQPASLQLVGAALWEELPPETVVVSRWLVAEHGDVETTLTGWCRRAVTEIAAQEDLEAPALWRWLEDTFVTDRGTRDVAYEGLTSTAGLKHSVARAFERFGILRSERRAASVWFELQDDDLIAAVQRGRKEADRHPKPAAPTGPRPLELAETALNEGLLDRADDYAEVATAAATNVSSRAEARFLRGRILMEQAQVAPSPAELFDRAEAEFQAAMAVFEGRHDRQAVARVLAALGRAYRLQGRFAEAVAALQGAANRWPGDADIFVELARAVDAAGQHSLAIGHFDAALTVAHDHVEALVGRGAVSADSGDPEAALADLDRAAQLDPGVALRSDVRRARQLALARSTGP